MPCRFASSGTVATSRSASRAILALNAASNFLRDLVISVLRRLRQSRTLHTLTFGPISGVHFRGRSPENAIFKQERCHIAFGRSWTGEWRPYGSTKQAEQFRYLLLRPELDAQPQWTHHETLSVAEQSETYPFLNSDSRGEWRRRGQYLKRKL